MYLVLVNLLSGFLSGCRQSQMCPSAPPPLTQKEIRKAAKKVNETGIFSEKVRQAGGIDDKRPSVKEANDRMKEK
jgi:hypothetical protein